MVSRVLLCFLLAVAIASVDCNLEGDILHSWKTILVDPNNVLAIWNRTNPNPCTWFHVTCNVENLVTRVDLGNAGLSGSIIPALANLTSFQYLELYQNMFYGSIPSEFGHLSKLVSLDLYQNHLSGSIPETFGHLDSLRYLRVFHNNLTGPIPMSLGNLKSLQILYMISSNGHILTSTKQGSYNLLETCLPLANYMFRKSTQLNKNRLTGTLPGEVFQLVRFGNLSLLDVSNNLLPGQYPAPIQQVMQLQKSYKIQELRTKPEESDEVEEDILCEVYLNKMGVLVLSDNSSYSTCE